MTHTHTQYYDMRSLRELLTARDVGWASGGAVLGGDAGMVQFAAGMARFQWRWWWWQSSGGKKRVSAERYLIQ